MLPPVIKWVTATRHRYPITVIAFVFQNTLQLHIRRILVCRCHLELVIADDTLRTGIVAPEVRDDTEILIIHFNYLFLIHRFVNS